MARRKKQKQAAEGAPEWMVTFSDLMTLLMTFFILLFSMSVVQETKFKAAAGSLRRHLGLMPAQLSNMQKQAAQAAMARQASQGTFREGVPGEHLEVMTIDEGKKIVVGGKVLFAEGSGTLLPSAGVLLQSVADRIRGMSNRIEIRGHAAPGEAATSGLYESEWELGWTRAKTVAGYLTKEMDIPANRLRIASSGSADPATANIPGDENNRNRRVEVVVTGELVR